MLNVISNTTALIANSKAISRLKTTLTVFLALLTIWGIVGFGLFIFEESSQVIMFSGWAAADVNRWDIMLEGADLMTKINNSSKFINKYFGWVNPISYASYAAYADATDIFISATIAKVFANDPSLFIGRSVTFNFTPKKTENLANGKFRFSYGRLHVISDVMPEKDKSGKISVTGVVEKKEGRLEIDISKK
jgi:hypothetical protein